jgi:tetratricopeptide (TPR) repeat protein
MLLGNLTIALRLHGDDRGVSLRFQLRRDTVNPLLHFHKCFLSTMIRSRLLVFKIITVLVVPILFLIVAESGLRVVGFGYNTDVFVEKNGQVRSNWPFAFKYFPWSMARPMLPLQFSAKKDDRTLRIFVLGGSAAQGFPAEEFGIAGQLQVMLERAYPDRTIEVINAAITAVNSHVILPVAKACLEYDPDYLVVYVGNNEVVGPHGAGTVFSGFSSNLKLLRMGDALKSMRLYQLLVMLSGKHKAPTGAWKGMEFFLGNTVYPDDSRLQTVYAQFGKNLEDIIDAADRKDCPVLLTTVGVNLLDNPPFASKKPNHAESEYQSGLAYLAEGKFELAGQAFERARDWDGLRFRADSKLNSVIREQASGADGNVTLVDSEQRIASDKMSPGGISGDAMFYDHVHLSFAGNYTVAKALAEAVFEKETPASKSIPEMTGVAELLVFSQWDRLMIAKKLTEQLLNKAPFTNQLNHREKQLSRKRETRKMAGRLNATSLQTSLNQYETVLLENPDDLKIKQRMSRLLTELGHHERAQKILHEVVEDFPTNHEALLELSQSYTIQGNFEKAEYYLEVLLKLNPHAIEVRNAYLKLLFDLKRFEDAVDYNENLVDDHPADPDIRFVFALILKAQGKLSEALIHLRKAVAIDPKHKEARSLLIESLRTRGDISNALKTAHAWTRSDPNSTEAFKIYGELLTKENDTKNGIENFKKAIELDPDYVIARSRYIQSMDQEGRIHEAIQFLGTQLKKDPDILEGHSMLGLTLDAAGRKKHALALLKVGLQLNPSDTKILRELAWIMGTSTNPQLRNGPEALRLAKRAVELAPNDPDFHQVLAAAYAENREFDNAINSARRALQLADTNNNSGLSSFIRKCIPVYEKKQPIRID